MITSNDYSNFLLTNNVNVMECLIYIAANRYKLCLKAIYIS